MNFKSMTLFAMTAVAFAQTNMKVWFGDGTGLDIHTESTGSNLPVSTSGSDVVPAGYDFHRVVFDKQGNLYTTTEEGGATTNGTVIKLTP